VRRTLLILTLGAVVVLAVANLRPKDASSAETSDDIADGSNTLREDWAFRSLARSTPPRVEDQVWIRNEIDCFVWTRLQTLGIEPSPRADSRTLIRRLYLDLIGLPPQPEEVADFLNDDDPKAYEYLVDRLLKSPHYGERWGRHWLDQARYADSHGYDTDQPRPHAWRYRHWVVEAFNRDLPFDQFTIQQLAGDLLPDPTIDQLIATGFHRNTLRNTEAGADPEEDRVKRTFDRTDATATVWLGLTLGCARCHDHKYDPLSQRDYYGLYAFFNSVGEHDLPAPLPADLADYPQKKAEFDRLYEQILSTRRRYEENLAAPQQRVWEANLGPLEFADWQALKPVELIADKGEALIVQDDSSILAQGPTPDETTYTIVAASELPVITGIRLEVLPHPCLPNNGPGRAPDGDFDLSSFALFAEALSETNTATSEDAARPRGQNVALAHPAASYWREGRPFADAIGERDQQYGWSIGSATGKRHVAVVELQEPIRNPNGTRLTFTLRQGRAGWFQVIGRFRLSVTATSTPFRVQEVTGRAADLLAAPESHRTEAQKARIRRYYCSRDAQWISLNQAVRTRLLLAPKDPQETRAQTISEMTQLRETRLFERGDFLRPTDKIEPGVPEVLPPLQPRGESPDRLDLARWMVDPANPLTARVAVNRIWQKYFGRGLVPSDEDFGTQGDRPSHAELLDWLAGEFMARGWSQKQLHKLIVMSSTYQQASDYRPELVARDPHNARLARQARPRVEAEIVRDLSLSVSGLLNPRVGGPSIVLPQPSGQDDLAFTRGKRLEPSWGPDLFRRGIYVWFQRTGPYPGLVIFDAPNSNVACTRRQRSTTPMQSLARLNDSFYYECARALGKKLLTEISEQENSPESVKRGMTLLYELCLSRPPNEDEWPELSQLYDEHREFYNTYQELAREVTVNLGVEPTDKERLSELATWIVIARIVLNLDEFVVRG
jgi:hypothetical protein